MVTQATPLERQYRSAKRRFLGAFVLVSNGDQYYALCDDAKLLYKLLPIVLCPGWFNGNNFVRFGTDELDWYVRKILDAGYEVAIIKAASNPDHTEAA